MKCFGRRNFSKHIKIILLDDQEIIQEVQRSTTGQELLDNVFKHLNIIETSYFGLRFVDNTGQTHWLDPGKYVIKQLNGTDPATFYFGVKFYAADPCKLFEEITRYQFFLQIKKDILQGRLTVSNELASTLGAHAIQSELGDYDPKRHVNGYVSEFRFISNQTSDLEEKIMELHKAMVGEVPAIAELNYLEKVKWLEMYGVDLHPVLGEDKIDYFLGLTPSGIIVLRNKNKVGNYFWPRITKISMKGKYFMIRVKNRAEEETYGFETPSKSACKHLWKCAMDHHTFFRLVQVTPTPNTNLKTFSLNNRFRDSNHSNMSSASRRRAQPQFIRTPSRRYTRRYVEGSELTASPHHPHHQESLPPAIPSHVLQSTQPKSLDSCGSWKPTPMSSSPKSARSVPAIHHHHQGHHQHSYSVPSPRSQRSRKRSKSIESNSSCDEGSHRRSSSRGHHHSRRKHRHSSSRKQSDGESEVSAHSRSSSKKRYRHKSRHYDQSGSDSENTQGRRRHRHRHRSSAKNNSEMIEWKEATMSTIHQAVSSVKTLGNEPGVNEQLQQQQQQQSQKYAVPHRPSSQSGQSHRSQSNHQRHHSRRSSADKQGSEIKKYFNYELIDTDGMSKEELNSLPFTNVMTNGEVSMKTRVIMKQNRHHKTFNNPNSTNGSNTGTLGSNKGHPVSQQQQHSIKSPPDVTLTKMCNTSQLPSNTGDNSPPPPYSPPVNESMNFGLPPQTPASQQGVRGTYHFQTKDHESDWSASLNRKKNITRSRAGIYDNIMSESPAKDQLENSDSGLGTDREYYRAENIMSSISYTLANPNNTAAPQRPPASYGNHQPQPVNGNYWNDRPSHEVWVQHQRSVPQPQHDSGPAPPVNNDMNRSSSLEMILSPLVSSTTTNRTRL